MGGGIMESFERYNDFNYKYDFLGDKNIFDEIGFIPHCDRLNWNEENVKNMGLVGETISLSLPLFEILRYFWDMQYGRFRGISHRRNKWHVIMAQHI